MGKFITKLEYRYADKVKSRIMLLNDLIYIDTNGDIYSVPKGFYSDGLSVPWLLRWYQHPFDEQALPAGIVHDFVLDSPDYTMPFTDCNNLFRRCLKARKVRYSKRKILEWATDINGLLIHKNKNPNTWDEHQK